MKDINEMSDHELLMELVAEKRRRDKIRYLKLACYGVVFLCILYAGFRFVPKVMAAIDSYNQVIAKYDALAEQLQGTRDQIDGIAKQFGDGTMEKLKSLIDTMSSFLERIGFGGF